MALKPLEFIHALELVAGKHHIFECVLVGAQVFAHGINVARLYHARMAVKFNTHKSLTLLRRASVCMVRAGVSLAFYGLPAKVRTAPTATDARSGF